VRPLHVAAANDANRFDNLERVAFQTFLKLLGDREERSCTEAVTRMDADRIDVLDEAHGDHLVLCVADDLDLKLFPVEDGFLNKALTGKGRVETAHAYRTKLFNVVAETAAAAAHRIGGTHHDRISNPVLNKINGLFYGMNDT